MKTNLRRRKIIEIVENNNSLHLKELSNMLNVSEMTLYRDIKHLKSNIFLVNGYVTYKYSDSLSEFPYYCRKKENKDLKIAIANAAINYINNNDTIFLDGSSTVEYFAQEIIKRNYYLTVVAISPIISVVLAKNDNIKILCPGGSLDKINFIYNCNIENFLKSININKAFLSCGAFSLENGFTDIAFGEYSIKKTLVKVFSEVYILADHTKIDKTYSYTWADYTSVYKLIIDSKIENNILEKLKTYNKPEIVLGKL
ncbi:MAG: DeoR/GlpR transcriptional regulator [Actinobacteria bacterium]|nr:DeoR/GlpR transcriptional regulator [Actinomycetota bacterium]